MKFTGPLSVTPVGALMSAKFWSLLLNFSLIVGYLTAIQALPANAVVPVCSSSMTAQHETMQLKATPSHGQVFYMDSGSKPVADAAYVGYVISTGAASPLTNMWVSIDGFSGGVVSLANPNDKYLQLDTISGNGSETAFFLLKASGSTTKAQAHTIKVFQGRPDISGNTAKLECTFSFTQVKQTIAASANKVTGISYSLSPTTATLGGTLTVTVNGDTGQVGAGSNPDGSIIWVSPAAVSSWPTRSLRLIGTTVTLRCKGTGTSTVTLTDRLYYSNADQCFKQKNNWTGVYVFRIIGPGPSSLSPAPIAIISSGTQYKHSSITSSSLSGAGFDAPVNLSDVATTSFVVKVDANATLDASSTASNAAINYTITMSTTSTIEVQVDEIVDNRALGTTFESGSGQVSSALLSPTTQGISDPITILTESGLSPPPYHFIGPYRVVNGNNFVLTYQMNIPCEASAKTYKSTAYAKVGDQLLGSSSTQISFASIVTQTSGASCSVSVTNGDDTLTPIGQTYPAVNVLATQADLRGYITTYGATVNSARFRYALDPNLLSSPIAPDITVSGTALYSKNNYGT